MDTVSRAVTLIGIDHVFTSVQQRIATTTEYFITDHPFTRKGLFFVSTVRHIGHNGIDAIHQHLVDQVTFTDVS